MSLTPDVKAKLLAVVGDDFFVAEATEPVEEEEPYYVSQAKEGIVSKQAFENFFRRVLPAEYREGAPPPANWEGPLEEWEDMRTELADDVYRVLALRDYMDRVVFGGFRPSELASGELEGGAEVNIMKGTVRRAPAATISLELEAQASAAVHDLRERGLQLSSGSQMILERAANRSWFGSDSDVQGALIEARSTIGLADARRAARQDQEVTGVRVRVVQECGPARKFKTGLHDLSQPEFMELRNWTRTMEAQHRHRSLASIGYPNWPPYELLENGAS